MRQLKMLRAEVEKLGKSEWRPMLRYAAKLHEACIRTDGGHFTWGTIR